ncbi:MAG: DNA polymerase/3'-5' exonuclease PolX [Anaerolineae bacterium]
MARLNNRHVAELFSNIADLLQIKGENRFKILAYRRAAENLAGLDRDLNDVWAAGELANVPGVGQAIHDKIDELLRTGRLGFWENLSAEIPPSLIEVLAIPDVGPKTARAMWQELGLTTVEQVKAAAEQGRLRQLPGLGPKSETKILAGIAAAAGRAADGRVHLGVAWPAMTALIEALEPLPEVERIQHAGSLRRFRPTIGDLDLLVATEAPAPVMDAFRGLPQVETVLLGGETKTSVRLLNGLQVDLRCLEPARWGTALQYFTGSQSHNIKIRELARRQGLSLNEYAFTRADGSTIVCPTEGEVYATLGLAYIPPELREDRGEIEAAQADQLPEMLAVEDIRGEVHCHSTWSDGRGSIEDMARAALARGYEYLAITDHSQSLGVTGGLTPERLRAQRAEIAGVQARVPGLRLLQGAEVEIKADGSLDYPDEVLAGLDFVVASIHTGLRQDREKLTRRMLNAIRHPQVHLIGHPSGRLLTRREAGDFDMEAILRAAAETGTMLEINAAPERLDLDEVHIRRAVTLGVNLIINCDAHHPDQFNNLRFGVATARRGWATAGQIANTRSIDGLLALARGDR